MVFAPHPPPEFWIGGFNREIELRAHDRGRGKWVPTGAHFVVDERGFHLSMIVTRQAF